jgi:hypothetical protein
MKKLLLVLFVLAVGYAASAQELSPDQNPNYQVSMNKYQALQTNQQTAMNTTVQDTYKAYDWRNARDWKKAERRADRRENRLFNNYNQHYYDPYNYKGRNNYGRPYQYRNYNGWRW